MKAVFLSIVVVCALVVAGIGGTLAGFSDTETSPNNYFDVGSLDLRVSDYTGTEYDDPNVPTLVQAGPHWPCQSADFLFDMHSLSEPDGKLAYAYIAFKNFICEELITDKHPDGRPEPEDVAELGGWLANQLTPALGPVGQNCTLYEFIEVVVEFDTDGDGVLEVVLGNPIWGDPGTVYLGDLWSGVIDECLWIYLCQIEACNTHDGKVSLHIPNWSEEMWNDKYGTMFDIFPDDKPFNDWPTNAFMNDKVTFEVTFALTQSQMPPDQVYQP